MKKFYVVYFGQLLIASSDYTFLFSTFCLVKLPPTEKVLAKNGLLCRHFQRKTEPEQKLFLPTKLVKNRRVEKFFADTAKSFLKDSIHPVFRQYNVMRRSFDFQFFDFFATGKLFRLQFQQFHRNNFQYS